jgi:hypothetical protein
MAEDGRIDRKYYSLVKKHILHSNPKYHENRNVRKDMLRKQYPKKSFKIKFVSRNEGHFIMIKGSILLEDITIIYTFNKVLQIHGASLNRIGERNK